MYAQAIAQYFSVQQTQQESLAFLYHNIASVYDDTGDYPQALAFYQKALLVFLKKLGTEHDYTKHTFAGMANSYLALGHTEEEFNQYLSDLLSNPLPPPTQED